jgi:hypothetical protein
MNAKVILCRACAAAIILLCSATSRAAITATFEGYAEGPLGGSFTESHSGIVFSNATYSGGVSTGFIAEYGDPPVSLAPVFPGTVLTTAISAPGPAVGLGGLAGFTATFPVVSNSVEMDVIFGSANSVSLTITGFSSTNQQVAQTIYPLSTTGLTVVHTIFNAPSPIKKIVVAPSGLTGFGYDNISIVPEPSSMALALAIGAISTLRRFRKCRA